LSGALIIADKTGVSVTEDSPLADTLVLGDIIISLENQLISQENDLLDLLLQYKIGQQINLKYLHDNIESETSIILE